MANMDYCRFENTARDLKDCAEHMEDELSGDELRARVRLVKLCYEILMDNELVGNCDLDEDMLARLPEEN